MGKNIEIIKATTYGFCGNEGNFGVSGAIKIAQKAAKENPNQVYVLGELVHNTHVVAKLKKEGIKTASSLDEIPEGAVMVIKAHGLGPAVLEEARKKKIKLIDATCPMVKAVHEIAKKYVSEGKKIIYVASEKKHEEAVGVWGEAPDFIKVVTLKELIGLKIQDEEGTVVLTQTTLSLLETQIAFEELQKRYPKLKIQPHICMATTMRQQAVMELAKKVDLVIIVGSKSSSNSNRLREVAESCQVKAKIVDKIDEVKQEWFRGVKKIGISSGASTPDEILEAVIIRIKELIKSGG